MERILSEVSMSSGTDGEQVILPAILRSSLDNTGATQRPRFTESTPDFSNLFHQTAVAKTIHIQVWRRSIQVEEAGERIPVGHGVSTSKFKKNGEPHAQQTATDPGSSPDCPIDSTPVCQRATPPHSSSPSGGVSATSSQFSR